MNSVDLGPFPMVDGFAEAAALDEADPLRSFADRFVPTEPELIYLDGNSLGRLPVSTVSRVSDVVDREWGDRLIRSWPERWWDLADEIGSQIAPLVGAQPSEVIVADSTSVVLFKLTVAALKARPERRRIVTDDLNFPTDAYVTVAAAELAGSREVVIVPAVDGINGPEDALVAALDEDTALLTLTHVAFKSGYRYDMARSDAGRPCRRGPCPVGSQPLGRRGAGRPWRRRSGPGRRLHLQVPERRTRVSGLPLREHPHRRRG